MNEKIGDFMNDYRIVFYLSIILIYILSFLYFIGIFIYIKYKRKCLEITCKKYVLGVNKYCKKHKILSKLAKNECNKIYYKSKRKK